MQRILLFLLTLTLLATAPADARKHVSRDTYAQGRDSEDAIYLESVRQRLAGHRDAAYELLNECLHINPNSQEALYDMAMIKLSTSALLDSASVAEGSQLLQRAYLVDTTNNDIRAQWASHLLSRGRYAEATSIYEQICATPTKAHHSLYADMGTLIQLYEIRGMYPEALAAVERIENLEGPDAMTAWERYQIYQCLGNHERALHTYDSLLVKAMPDPATPIYIREQLKRVPRYHDKFSSLQQELLLSLEGNDHVSIRTLCTQMEALIPEHLVFYLQESISCLAMADTTAALDACHRGFNYIQPSQNPDFAAQLYATCGDIYTAQRNIEAAVEMYESAFQCDSTLTAICNNYAYQLALLGRQLELAEKMSLRAMEEYPDDASIIDTYAWVLFRQGRYREARKAIDRALRLADDPSEELYQHRNSIYEALRHNK